MTSGPESDITTTWAYRASRYFAIVLSLLAVTVAAATIIAALVMVVKLAASGPVTVSQNPLNTIFGSRLMVAAIRLVVLFGVAYVIFSILVLMRRGQVLTGVGPLQVSQSVGREDELVQRLTSSLEEAIERNAELEEEAEYLRNELLATNELLDRVIRESTNVPEQEGDADASSS